MVARVVDKFVIQLEAQLQDRDVAIELTPEARDWLVRIGYDATYGARPMARAIQEHIKTPLADELLFGKLAKGGIVRVGLGEGRLTFEFLDPKPPGRKAPARGPASGKVDEPVD